VLPLKDVIPPRRFPTFSTAITVAAGLAFPVLWWRGVLAGEETVLFAVSLLFLCMFADTVEDRLGPARFLVIYAVGHAVGTLIALRLGVTPTVGLTSPAVAAIVGAYVVLYPNSRVLLLTPVPLDAHEVPALFFVSLFFIMHVAGGASVLAPVGAGFAAGALACLGLKRPMVW
jgi:membrane associated rhomboid family serine protease